jgi:hypothetical protein
MKCSQDLVLWRVLTPDIIYCLFDTVVFSFHGSGEYFALEFATFYDRYTEND